MRSVRTFRGQNYLRLAWDKRLLAVAKSQKSDLNARFMGKVLEIGVG